MTDGMMKPEEKLIPIPRLAASLLYTAALQGFFAFYALYNLAAHDYLWAVVELVFLGIWTWILKAKLDRWRTPE
jgi:hypothetical protein